MSPRAALIWSLALSACDEATVRVPDAAVGKTLVLALLGADGAPVELRSFDHPKSTALVLSSAIEELQLVAFDAPAMELFAAPSDEGLIEQLTTPDTSVAWPLPEPSGAWTIEDGTASPTDARWIATTLVRRPPCPSLRVTRIDVEGDVRSALVRGDSIWMGVAERRGLAVVRARLDGAELDVVHAQTASSASLPVGYLDGAEAWFVLGDELVAFDEDGAISRTRTSSPAGLAIDAIDGVGDAIAARTVAGDFYALDVDRWRLVHALPEDSATCPALRIRAQVFDLVSPDRLLAGIDDGPITELDLQGATPPFRALIVNEPRICRSVYAPQPEGISWISYSRTDERERLLWRWRDGDWTPDMTETLSNARGLAVKGAHALVGGSGDILVLLEHSSLRPELPPRVCARAPSDAVRILGIRGLSDTSFVAYGLSGAVRVEVVAPAL